MCPKPCPILVDVDDRLDEETLMKRTRVNSSNIASVGYDAQSQMLEVEFQNGSIYQYASVPKSVYDAFMVAPSKGRFLNDKIRDRYRHRQVV